MRKFSYAWKLRALARRGRHYTRWVDDVTISCYEHRKPEEFLGAVGLTQQSFPVAEDKIYFQDQELVFLLGYKMFGEEIRKNSAEERKRLKTPAIKFEDYKYEKW